MNLVLIKLVDGGYTCCDYSQRLELIKVVEKVTGSYSDTLYPIYFDAVIRGLLNEGHSVSIGSGGSPIVIPESKYQTEPQNYTNCHPIIAEHLKAGLRIRCYVWDGNNKGSVSDIYAYFFDGVYPYRAVDGMYANARPYVVGLYLKKASELIKIMEGKGVKPDERGVWFDGVVTLKPSDFKYCGKEVKSNEWPEEWMEEK